MPLFHTDNLDVGLKKIVNLANGTSANDAVNKSQLDAAVSGLGTVTQVAASAPAEGFTITGSPINTSGTLTFALANDLSALEGLASTGIAVRSATDTWVQRSLTVSTGADSFASLAVGNANGVSGNPLISIATDNSTMKLSVECATTANITLSGLQTIDGITVSSGQRVLVKNQTTGADNGIYAAASGAWTRTTDYNTNQKAENGLLVFVQGGIVNANTYWKVDQSKPTIGTTALTFTETLTNAVGATAFTGLTDAPSSYSGEGGKFVRVNAGASNLEFVASPIVSLGGLTVATQTFDTGTTGTDFGISSTGSTHTFNIPSASNTNRGLVTTGAQIFAGAKTFFGNLQVGATGRSDSLVIANTAGNTAVLTAGGNCNFAFPSSDGTSGFVLTTNGAGVTSWAAVSGLTSLNGLSGGTQTFATGTTGFDFGIDSTGTTHTFNIPDASYNARGFVATSAQTFGGEKTFRHNIILGFTGAVTGQISMLGSGGGTVILKPAAVAGTWTMTLPTTGGTSGFALTTDGSGGTTWSQVGNVLNGGNSFAGAMTIGTNDNNSLSFETNGTTVGTIGTDGNVTLAAIGTDTTGPTNRLIIDTGSSNTPTTTFGGAVLFRGKSASTASQDMGTVASEWVVATHVSRTSNITFTGVNNAAALADYMRVGPTTAGGVVSLRLGGGSTVYQNAGITTGASYTLGGSANSLAIGGSSGTININNTATGTTAIVISADGTAASSRIQIGNVAASHTTGTKHTMAIVQGYTVASGAGELVSLYFDTPISQTGTASGAIYGIRMAPSFAGGLLGQYYGVHMNFDNASAWGVYQSGTTTRNYFAGNTGFGTASTPNRPLQIGGTSAITIPVGTTGQRPGTPQVGDIRVNSSVNVLEYYDGSDWQAPGGVSAFLALTDTPSSYSGQAGKFVAVNATATALEFVAGSGGGISTLNTLTAATQTFAVGTSGTDFAIVSGTSTHTFNLPDAAAASRGVVSTGTQTFGGAKTFPANITLGAVGGASGKVSLLGTTSGTVGIQAAAAAGTWDLTLPTTGGTNGWFLQTNGSGVTTWAAAGGSGDVLQNGNSFAAAMIIGTNDNNTLSLEQNGVTALTIGTDKNVTLIQTGTETNAVTNRLILQTNTTNTVEAGFGTGILFQAESSTTNDQDLGTIRFLWADHTHGTRTSDAVFFGVKSGAAVEMLRLKANTGATSYFTVGGGSTQWSNSQIAVSGSTNFVFSATAGLVVPSGTTAQRTDANGAIRYNSSTGRVEGYSDSIWRPIDQGSIVDINAQTGTTYTLAFNDIGQLVTLDNASAITLTIPTNASVAFPIGTTINLYRKGAGSVTVGGASVTIRSADSKLKLRAQYSTASLTKIGTDEWILFGDISA